MPAEKKAGATQRRELDAALHAEAKFRTLVSLSSDWYWEQDAEFRFIETTARTDARGGIGAQAHLGKRRWELPGTEPVNTTWAEHQALLQARLPFYYLILRRRLPPNPERYVKTSGAPVFDDQGVFTGYRGIGKDITDEHCATVALRESELRSRVLAEMVEQSTDAIYARDLEGRTTYWNAGAERLYGFTAHEAVGQPLRSLNLRMLDDAELGRIAARIRSGVRHSFEAQRPDKNGHAVDVAINTAPLHDAQGAHVGEVCVVRDISAAMRNARELLQAKEAAEAANAAKGQFLANMSHEIRTPLNGILGMTRLVLDGPLEAEQRQLLSLVMASGNALATVINDILDFSKIEAGKLDVEVVEFQPLDLLPDIVRTQALRAREKGLELRSHAQGDIPRTLLGDPGRLRQVLLNLLGNALKFTERGEVEVTLDVLSREADAAILRIGVRDTGIGIAPDRQSDIFDAFSQGEGGITRRYGGTGLGLTISARLVELMGGRIWVNSEPGKGSQFYFTVRCGLPEPTSAVSPGIEAQRLKGLRVLVVDDNDASRDRLAGILASWGMAPHMASDGTTGLAMVGQARHAGRPYRLVLLDLILPGSDGFAVAQALRHEALNDNVVLMMITGHGQRHDAARCREIGIRAYLSKPVKPFELYSGIVSALATDETSAAPTLITRHSLRERLPGAKILLVEDNEINRILATTILERMGHSATVAEDGAEAVALCAQQPFDLVLMDMQMPRLDGLQATALIRCQGPAQLRLPIVALTANALNGDRERCLAAGMDDYLAKPFDAKQLAAKLERWLPGRAEASAFGQLTLS
jgi:two-component system, sensor histidine kinase and response regulator